MVDMTFMVKNIYSKELTLNINKS